MSDELERLKRLRNRQLADRDPKVKQKSIQSTYVRKENKARGQRYTLKEAWNTIPNIYHSPFICFLIGFMVVIFLPRFWDSVWAFWVGVGATVFLVILGAVIGQAQDVRDNLRDFSKH